MSVTQAQHSQLDEIFTANVAAIHDLQRDAKAALKELVIQKNLDADTAAWAQDSLDTRELIYPAFQLAVFWR